MSSSNIPLLSVHRTAVALPPGYVQEVCLNKEQELRMNFKTSGKKKLLPYKEFWTHFTKLKYVTFSLHGESSIYEVPHLALL